jgi:hypothetical protein
VSAGRGAMRGMSAEPFDEVRYLLKSQHAADPAGASLVDRREASFRDQTRPRPIHHQSGGGGPRLMITDHTYCRLLIHLLYI